MTQKTLDAILTRGNTQVGIALRCINCDTVIKIGRFPLNCPFFKMTEWIKNKNDTAPLWHNCAGRVRLIPEYEATVRYPD